MSPTWGSVEQYSGIIWPWPIAVYLFLAGLSAGAIISAIIVKWMKGNDTAPWDGIIKAGAILAPLTIGVGLALELEFRCSISCRCGVCSLLLGVRFLLDRFGCEAIPPHPNSIPKPFTHGLYSIHLNGGAIIGSG